VLASGFQIEKVLFHLHLNGEQEKVSEINAVVNETSCREERTKHRVYNIQTKTMILSDERILQEIEKGTIKIEPYSRECLGSNSYDVHLGKWLATYKEHILDAKKHNQIEHFEIPEDGFVLYPHVFYLGVTDEYTETHAHVPFLKENLQRAA
jgi:hypothetical protein